MRFTMERLRGERGARGEIVRDKNNNIFQFLNSQLQNWEDWQAGWGLDIEKKEEEQKREIPNYLSSISPSLSI